MREEGKIREQEAELRQIVDVVPQLVAVFGPGGERLYANRIGLDYVGLSLEEWLEANRPSMARSLMSSRLPSPIIAKEGMEGLEGKACEECRVT